MIGRTLGRYRIVEPLGRGGMGEVYKAFDEELGREVAMKLLPQKIAANETRLRRFRREARTLGALEHPNIVSLYSVEQVDDLHFLIMELVEGETVEVLTPEFGMDLETLFDIAIPMADALAEAHDRGIVHRDLKPSNVLVDGNGLVRVLDFGLARVLESADETLTLTNAHHPRQETASPQETQLTRSGGVMGTPSFLSPEHARGQELTPATDPVSMRANSMSPTEVPASSAVM